MELLLNITIDPDMGTKISSNNLTISDRVKLTLANFVAGLFAKAEVFINPQKQGVKAQSFFISFYEVNKSRKLAYTAKYEYGFTISYFPKNSLSNTELHDVEFAILQNITDLQTYKIHSVNSDITDGILNITGVITVNEKNISTDPIIMKAKENIKHGK